MCGEFKGQARSWAQLIEWGGIFGLVPQSHWDLIHSVFTQLYAQYLRVESQTGPLAKTPTAYKFCQSVNFSSDSAP